ncbi:MAG: ABC transporter ATP-binding protein [Vulcanisaeta sp.]|uniref:ABC transporter ATP-binding protein n=1 Tax=Vulcanisaeta sp. TaxID=2020871 RepID=UPI003D13FB83
MLDQGIHAINVVKAFGNNVVVKGITLSAMPNSITCIVGPSGSGKSTLLRIMVGLLKPDSGRVIINGVDIHNDFGAHDVVRLMSYVPQDDALISGLTVRENMELALRVQGVSKGERLRRIEEVSRLLGIQGILGKKPTEVSGGERRRVSIAIALARDHEFLVLDEPTNSLDRGNVELLLQILREEAGAGRVVLVATHDQYLVRNSDRIYAIRAGELVSEF